MVFPFFQRITTVFIINASTNASLFNYVFAEGADGKDLA